MNKRCPGNEFLGPAKLIDYRLIFDGHSKTWGGAVANIIESPGDIVRGGLFEISEANLAALDCYEGYPASYNRKNIIVLKNEVTIKEVITYYRTVQKSGPPSQGYKKLLLLGAKDSGLPDAYINHYIKMIAEDEFKEDYGPKTITEAIELWMSQDEENIESDLIDSVQKDKLDWMYNNLKRRIIDLYNLRNNDTLREACGSKDMSPDDAARTISDALWKYFHGELFI